MKIMNSNSFSKYTGDTLRPINIDDDKEIEQAIREEADTVYHPVGTCKMGSDDMSVVSSNLKVHGIESLRVVDASIMPTLIGGNTNAPTIMIGEKASDMILNDWKQKKLKTFYIFLIFISLGIISDEYLIIDVRTQEEFQSGHIENASNIQWQNIAIIQEKITKDKKIYLYCRSGNRSQKATDILIELGYRDVLNIGGLEEAAILLDKKIVND